MGFFDKVTGAFGQVTDFGSKVTDPSGDIGAFTGTAAADASLQGSALAARGQADQLAYLKQVNALPMFARDMALTQLSARSGYTAYTPPPITAIPDTALPDSSFAGQGALIDQAKQSPLYAEIMGGRDAGEEAILRNAAATGGLRSGNVQENLYDYNVGLGNTALSAAYNQAYGEEGARYGREQTRYGQEYNRDQTRYGHESNRDQTQYAQNIAAYERKNRELQTLAGLNTGESEMGGVMAGMGKTQAQGLMGAAQAQQSGAANVANIGMGIASLFI